MKCDFGVLYSSEILYSEFMNQKINAKLYLWISSFGIIVTGYMVFFTHGVIFSILHKTHGSDDEPQSDSFVPTNVSLTSLSPSERATLK